MPEDQPPNGVSLREYIEEITDLRWQEHTRVHDLVDWRLKTADELRVRVPTVDTRLGELERDRSRLAGRMAGVASAVALLLSLAAIAVVVLTIVVRR